MDHLYQLYITERNGDGLVIKDIEGQKIGFASFRYLHNAKEKWAYIIDIFVKQEFRKQKYAREMADKIAEIAKKENCQFMLGSVDYRANNAHESMLILLAYDMKLYRVEGDLILFKKEI